MGRTRILKLMKDQPDQELDFELDFLASLTVQQRFEMMIRRSQEIKRMLRDHGNLPAAEVIKRT